MDEIMFNISNLERDIELLTIRINFLIMFDELLIVFKLSHLPYNPMLKANELFWYRQGKIDKLKELKNG